MINYIIDLVRDSILYHANIMVLTPGKVVRWQIAG